MFSLNYCFWNHTKFSNCVSFSASIFRLFGVKRKLGEGEWFISLKIRAGKPRFAMAPLVERMKAIKGREKHTNNKGHAMGAGGRKFRNNLIKIRGYG